MSLGICSTETNRQGRELTEHGTTLFPAACYDDDLALEAVPWHWHEELEAVVVDMGTTLVSAGSRTYTIKQGCGIFINASSLHSAWAADHGGCRLHSIVFHPRLVGGSVDSIFWQGYLQPLLSELAPECVYLDSAISWNREALKTIGDAWQSCVSGQPGYEFQVRAFLSQLIFLLADHHPAVQKTPSDKVLRNGERIKIMLQYIQEHYGEELTIARIAQEAMISDSECLRCFRAAIGTTPIQYVKQFRIQRAAELLTTTDSKIEDIGAQCGFQEMSYFSKAFRLSRGCTPGEYRKQHRITPQ